MKTTQRFAMSAVAAAVLLALGACAEMSTRDSDTATGAAFAQGALPQCENSNYDQARGIFTVMNPGPYTVNQQCLLTIHPKEAAASSAQYPAPFLVEGDYAIEMSGGGGGGGAGGVGDQGGGGGGAGAAPYRTIKYLAPGVYKLTLGTGGEGGMPGARTQAGNPSSLTKADTGELVAGFPGADVWAQRSQAPGGGRGGAAAPGGSRGGSGGDSGPSSEEAAQAGGASQTAGYAGMPGQAGTEGGRGAQAEAGGGGGAGVGSGGAGQSAGEPAAAGIGDLGGGGGGGRGGAPTAEAGGTGGHGFIRLSPHQ